MFKTIAAVAAVFAGGCKQDHVAPRSASMADLIAPADRVSVDAAPQDPRAAAAFARIDDAARAAQERSDPAAMRAELRTRLGPPSLDLDGWIEWAVADDEDCDSVWIEHADAREVEHQRITPEDASADLDACRALAAGDPRARIIGSVAYARGAFDSPAAARVWLRRNLGAPARELTPAGDHKSVWATVVGAACFTIEIDDAAFDRVLAGRGYRDFEPEYADCKRWSEGRGG